MEKKTKQIIIKCVKILLLIFIILLSYTTGRFSGILIGIDVTQKINDKSVCDLFIQQTDKGIYKDKEGYCVLKENAEYDVKINCSYGNFRIKGNKKMGIIQKILYLPQKVMYYPIIGCW